MRFLERLAAGRFAVALEITPPQRHLPKVLLRRARLLGDAADAVNVIQRPDRQSSLAASLELRAAGIDPVWHLAARGMSAAEVTAAAEAARAGGIEQVLCVAGDHAANGAPGVTVREAIGLVRAAMPGVTIGATLNQYARDPARARRNLLPKLLAGATYVQTQPTFDVGGLEAELAAVRPEAEGVAAVAMAMPLLTAEAGERIAHRLGLELPGRLRDILSAGDTEAAWAYFRETVARLVESPAVQGVAIMTFEMDPPPEMGERIVAALEAAGAR
ncbi:methylenetetrahydrofolate reductase [Tepidiforma thermophila]|uniref:Methylenetetrahydrofolate reductase n=1 Tax=Tepidiforma thermophila (strain KCTC 52669 / CGMCC 1.13589 / G233) TaxID=2761530 RepID=A0A2A9HFT8_TEPT2|nr:methylenetetrahydrofolate reductase [Tepidiforma thermophila]PFG74001.1 5,10-methylenetetrahydrofolate reductase (ferredoxin) [Tepidiforma thermophila]